MLMRVLKHPPSPNPLGPSELQAHVEARIERDPNSGCWLWTAALSAAGYGVMCMGGRWPQRSVRAHRIAYIAWAGEIPDGLVIDHKCRTRCCVNPAHLRAVTPAANVLENSASLTAANAAKTHCVRGHELPRRTGKGRNCPVCAKLHQERHSAIRRQRTAEARAAQ
jgi:hypothetical protein